MLQNFSIANAPIDAKRLSQDLQNDAAGACVTFEGRVRDHNEGHKVLSLDYEVYRDLATTEGEKILAEAAQKFSILTAQAVHREGRLKIGDCAVWVGVLAAHRGEAYAASRYIIDEIKHRLPIWKKEHYADGKAEWVNCQHHHGHAHSSTADISEKEFYARQILLPEVGEAGQAKLKAAKVLVVGAGGLGCAALNLLAASGVGKLGIVEHDVLAASNLHRQMLYSAADVGKPKVEFAAARLRALNPFITVKTHHHKADTTNIMPLLQGYDLVLDCTDNFTTKYLLNDAAVLSKKPLIQASIYRFEGQVLTIDTTSDAGCLRCLWPEAPAQGLVGDCAEVGVLGSVPAICGGLQANQAIQHILGLGSNKDLLLFDLLTMESRKISRHRRPDCLVCGDNPSIVHLQESEATECEFKVSIHDARGDLLQKFIWIDVREDNERRSHPLPEAEHHSLNSFDMASFHHPKEASLLIICAKGFRSAKVAERLRKAGWMNVFSLAGGIEQLPKHLNMRVG